MPIDLPAVPTRQADLPLPESTGKRPMREMGELDRHRVSQLIVNEDGGATYGSAKIFGGVCGADGLLHLRRCHFQRFQPFHLQIPSRR